MIRLFAGLGNPGTRYSRNRHNLGFQVIDRFAKTAKVKWRETPKFVSGSFNFEATKIWLLKPLTYMNLSGEALAPFARKKGISPEEILVIHDEVALPLGQIRLKPKGGAGGHNGLTSVIVSLGSDEFNRLRLGVNAPPPGIDLAAYVLADFMAEEEAIIEEIVKESAEVCLRILTAGIPKTMTTVNMRKAP